MPNDDLYNSVYFTVSSEFEERLKKEMSIPSPRAKVEPPKNPVLDAILMKIVCEKFSLGRFYKPGSEERRQILEEIKRLLGPDTKLFALKMIDVENDFWWPYY